MAELNITVCFSAAPRTVCELALVVAAAGTVEQAVAVAAVHADWPAAWADKAQWAHLTPSLWGRKVAWNEAVREGDRLELCRPLRVDPKVARRERFKKQGAKRAGLFAKKRPGAAAGY